MAAWVTRADKMVKVVLCLSGLRVWQIVHRVLVSPRTSELRLCTWCKHHLGWIWRRPVLNCVWVIIRVVERCRRCTLRNTCLATRRAERFWIGICVLVWFPRMFNSVRGGLLWNDCLDRQHAIFAAFCVVSQVMRYVPKVSVKVEYKKDAQHVPKYWGHATDLQERFGLRVIPGWFTIFRTKRVLHKPLKKRVWTMEGGTRLKKFRKKCLGTLRAE